MTSSKRRAYLKSFLDDVFVPQRKKLLAYREVTRQTAQVDSDGYLAQIIASIVLGVPGNARRGKSGDYAGDLADGTEVKSAYRAEQMNGMEDSHINFGQISPQKLRDLFQHERVITVHTAYDIVDRLKIEVLSFPVQEQTVQDAVESFLARSSAARPQLQPRLYPDGRRDRLQLRPGHFHELGARLLARAVVVGDEVVVDKWEPDSGLDLEECLDVLPGVLDLGNPHVIADTGDPDEFFLSCMVAHRRALIPYCSATASNQNVGFGNLSQHLVSVVTGIPGTGSGARGYDLEDTSEIKLAMGLRGDALGTEDYPRLNLQSNVEKMLSWRSLYPVRIICDEVGLKVKVLKPDTAEFRRQVKDYFGPRSRFKNSPNMQYHVPIDFNWNSFSGLSGDGSNRVLECEVLYCAAETASGGVRPC